MTVVNVVLKELCSFDRDRTCACTLGGREGVQTDGQIETGRETERDRKRGCERKRDRERDRE